MKNSAVSGWEEEFGSDLEAAMEFRSFLTPETDRGCALIAAAYLDERLSQLLHSYFADDPSVARDVLGQSKPLGTFSSRIDVAYLLGLIGKEEQRGLHLIRKIRNEFGHVAKPILFSSTDIANRCKNLESLSSVFVKKRNGRRVFTSAVMALLAAINSGLRTVKHREIRKDIDRQSKAKALDGSPILRVLLEYSNAPTAINGKALESEILKTLGHNPNGVNRSIALMAKRVVDAFSKRIEKSTAQHRNPSRR